MLNILGPTGANVLGVVGSIIINDFIDRGRRCAVTDRSRLVVPAW